jgi:hypothetical protein
MSTIVVARAVIAIDVDGLQSELPPIDRLSAVLLAAGISDQ